MKIESPEADKAMAEIKRLLTVVEHMPLTMRQDALKQVADALDSWRLSYDPPAWVFTDEPLHDQSVAGGGMSFERGVWQEMATAPKDGTPVLLLIPSLAFGHRVQIGSFFHTVTIENGKTSWESSGWRVAALGFLPERPQPTKWMWLPSENAA